MSNAVSESHQCVCDTRDASNIRNTPNRNLKGKIQSGRDGKFCSPEMECYVYDVTFTIHYDRSC